MRGSLYGGHDDWRARGNRRGLGSSVTEDFVDLLHRIAACRDKSGVARIFTL